MAQQTNYNHLLVIEKFRKTLSDSIKITKIRISTKSSILSESDNYIKQISKDFEKSLEITVENNKYTYHFTDSIPTTAYIDSIDQKFEDIKHYEAKLFKEKGLYRRCGTNSPIMVLENELFSLFKWPEEIPSDTAKLMFNRWQLDVLFNCK